MGVMHFLKGYYSGTLGETVGGKWKNLGTIRVKVDPSNPDTPAQQHQRTNFGELSSKLSLIAPQLKPYSALDTRKMSLRNQIIHLNKAAMEPATVDWASVQVSRGSLPNPGSVQASYGTPSGGITVTWTPQVSQLISATAEFIVVILHRDTQFSRVAVAPYVAGTLAIPSIPAGAVERNIWGYILDKRGSTKVASISVQATIS